MVIKLQIIYGDHYCATTANGRDWAIMRGRFLMANFAGPEESISQELERWDNTVTTTKEQDYP